MVGGDLEQPFCFFSSHGIVSEQERAAELNSLLTAEKDDLECALDKVKPRTPYRYRFGEEA